MRWSDVCNYDLSVNLIIFPPIFTHKLVIKAKENK
jgi:hypothetical protein